MCEFSEFFGERVFVLRKNYANLGEIHKTNTQIVKFATKYLTKFGGGIIIITHLIYIYLAYMF